jgi:hypothetical protein
MGSSKRVPPYLLLVLLAVGAAAVSVGILHKMRERRVLAVLLQERDQQLISFQVLLEVPGMHDSFSCIRRVREFFFLHEPQLCF